MKKKRIWIIVGIVVVAVAAGGVYLATRQTANGQARNFLANAATAKVVRTTLASSVDSTGSINPEARVPLSFGTSGTVSRGEGQGGRSGEARRCPGVARYDGLAEPKYSRLNRLT